jgi:hypothetical protein
MPKKFEAIKNMACPITRRDLRCFIGIVHYYRDMWVLTHDELRGDTVVVHPTAHPIENYRALQKGGARLVIHALYYESRINMTCRSFFLNYYHAQIRAEYMITQRTFYCLNSNNTCFF